MNEARKALIKMQTAPPGVPVGRFHPQLATLADFFDNLVNLKTENNALHRQLLEAHERFGKLLGDSATPPASKPDQAQTASKLHGNKFNLLIIDEYTEEDRAARRSPKVTFSPEMIEEIRNFDITTMYRDNIVYFGSPPCQNFANHSDPTFAGMSGKEIIGQIKETVQILIDNKQAEYARLNEGAPFGYEVAAYKGAPFLPNQKFSYKQYIAAGWTDNLLIQNGLLVKVQPNA